VSYLFSYEGTVHVRNDSGVRKERKRRGGFWERLFLLYAGWLLLPRLGKKGKRGGGGKEKEAAAGSLSTHPPYILKVLVCAYKEKRKGGGKKGKELSLPFRKIITCLQGESGKEGGKGGGPLFPQTKRVLLSVVIECSWRKGKKRGEKKKRSVTRLSFLFILDARQRGERLPPAFLKEIVYHTHIDEGKGEEKRGGESSLLSSGTGRVTLARRKGGRERRRIAISEGATPV